VSIKALLGLILCNVVWSANPAMAKIVLRDFVPAHAALLRYSSALLGYLLAILVLSRVKTSLTFFALPKKGRDWLFLFGLGFFAFCFSPFLQLTGLNASRATDSALVTALEPLATVFLAWIFLGENLKRTHVFAFLTALAGFALLSGVSLTPFLDSHFIGNIIILISLVGEASYSIFGKKLVRSFAPLAVFGSGLTIGVVLLAVVTFLKAGFLTLDNFNTSNLLALLFLGPLGTTASYIFWMIVLKNAPVASIALTLFVQPIMGAVWGNVFLGERLTGLQSFGGVIILMAVFSQSLLGYLPHGASRFYSRLYIRKNKSE